MAFNFGTPAGNAGGSGFSFGASTPKPAFGATAAPAFGTSTPAFGTAAPAFGVTPSSAAPVFGANITQQQPAASGLGAFGASVAPAATAAPLSFGGFGALGVTKPTGTVQPLSLGNAASTAAAPVLPTFGQATAGAQPTLTLGGLGGLGGTAATAAAPVPAAGAFSFGATAAAPALSAAVAPTLGGFSTTTSAAAPSLGLFGKPSTTTTTTTSAIPSLFGAASGTLAAAAPAATGLFGASTAANGGLFGTNTGTLLGAMNAAPGANVAAATVVVPKLGLGGVDTNASQPKTVEGRSESARAKEAQLPQEIVATVESLKQHIKQQKQYSSDIARTSTHKLFNVSGELQSLNWSLAEVANCVQTNHAAIKQLRYETAGAIRQAEMAQRTHEIQPGLQFENTAPLRFFMELVQKFEADMISFRNQVELTEKHMRSLANPQSFSADDLKKGLQQIHESFIALAGRLHETHQKVEAQKEQYLNLRKHLLKDKTNVFEEQDQNAERLQTMAHISCGPTPFSATFGIHLGVSSGGSGGGAHNQTSVAASGGDVSGFGLLGRSQQAPNSFLSATPANNAASQLSFGAFGGGATSTLSTTGGGQFNLQNPPTGSKRNKQ